MIEPGYVCTTQTTGQSTSIWGVCGDGVVVNLECDDWNLIDGDGCSSTWSVEPGYEWSGSPSDCDLIWSNGVIDAGETWDDGNLTNGDGWSSSCSIEDGYVWNHTPLSICTLNSVWGDGVIDANEQWDDANTLSNDGWDPKWSIEQYYVCTGQPSECEIKVELNTVESFINRNSSVSLNRCR